MASLWEMKSGVPARSLFRGLFLAVLPIIGVTSLFTSCAHRGAPSPSNQAAASGEALPASTPASPYRKVSSRSLDEASDRIVAMVQTGKLAQSGENFLIFIRSRNDHPTPTPSLYGDAAALGRLRSKLKTVPGIPESSCHQATVRNASAVIPIEDSLPATTVANIVDTALTVDLLRSVRIDLPTAPR